MINFLTSNQNRTKQEELLKKFILKIGVNEYCSFVQNYNKEILEAVKNGKFPTNNEILIDGIINIDDKMNKTL